MSVRSLYRFLFPALLPLALAACANSELAVANPPAAPPLGVDLGSSPARSTGAVELASASAAPMIGMDHAAHGTAAQTAAMNHAGHGAGHGTRTGEIQMVHEGHTGTHGTGTVTTVNAAQRKIGLQHEPIPAIGWPAMNMELAVAPSVNLQGIQPGSRVNFSLEKGPDGIYMIQSIQPAGASR